MNKKISILAIIFSGILSVGAFAGDKIDASERAGKNLTIDGNDLNNIQGYLNTAVNPLMPGSKPEEGFLGTSLADREEPSTMADQSAKGWGTTIGGENYVYKTKIDGADKSNCKDSPVTVTVIDPVTGKKERKQVSSCKFDSTKKSLTLKTVAKAGNDGYNDGYLTLNNTEPSVIFEPDNDGKYFYKFWQKVNTNDYDNCYTTPVAFTDKTPCECQMGKAGGCWSPLFPVIRYQDSNKNYPSLAADKTSIGDDEDKARDFYGERNYDNRINSYKEEGSEGQDAYRMKVKVAAHKEDGVKTGTIHSKDGTSANAITTIKSGISTKTNRPNKEVRSDDVTAVLSVKSWTVKDGKLDPNFNYASMGPNRVLQKKGGGYNTDLNEIYSVSSESTDNVLPCGMFEKTENPDRDLYGELAGVKCLYEDGDGAIRQSRYDSTTDETKKGEQMYTYYHVALPNGYNSYEPTFTHKLKYRACAVCKPLNKDNCRRIVNEYINRNNGSMSVGNLIAALRNNNNAINIGIFETQTRPSGKGANLTGSSADSDFQYNGRMTCSTCLRYLDELLTERDIISRLTEK